MLIDALRARLGEPVAPSFRLMGEDLQLLTVDDALVALADQRDKLESLAPELRARLATEERDLATEAHRWLRKYNRSLYGRVAGYVELGRRCEFLYPWPVVAILGIVQVMSGMDRARLYGLAGRVASRLGYPFYEQLGDASEDILRRTNRGIFADSVPTVLRALRAVELRETGDIHVADALVDGTAALLWDGESRALCRAIADGLAIADEAERFETLAKVTLEHFAREQSIFTHHIAARNRNRKIPGARSVPAPVIARGRLAFRPYRLPRGFDLRDHSARVIEFGLAFVISVTRSLADYRIARDYVIARFARPR